MVDRIERHPAVIAPTISTSNLHAGSCYHCCLRTHRVEGVCPQPTIDVNTWLDRSARLAVAERNVLVLVHGDRSHPPVRVVRVIRTRLKNRRSGTRAAGVSKFIPSNRPMLGITRTALDADIADKRLLHRAAAEVPIRQPIHQVEREVIEIVSLDCWRRLRDAIEICVGGTPDTGRDTPSRGDLSLAQCDRWCSPPRYRHPGRVQAVVCDRVRPNDKRRFIRGRWRETVKIRREKSILGLATIFF